IERVIAGEDLPPSQGYQQREVKNVVDALNSILFDVLDGQANKLISKELILTFHQLIGKNLGETFAAIPGKFRNNEVIVNRYRCPDHRDVEPLIDKLCAWMQDEFAFGKKRQAFHNVLIQAIVCHVYLEWIHPFSDGNGRTGRLLEFYILIRGGNPDIASHILSNYYNQTRPQYYYYLDKAAKDESLTSFIEYALVGYRDGLQGKLKEIQNSQFENTWQRHVYDTFDNLKNTKRNVVFRRQRRLALNLPLKKEFSAEEVGEISIPLAKLYGGISLKTIQRDLNKLEQIELIKREGKRYHTNTLNISRMMAKQNKII
ncbi:MAG TPA: Fic family protein, partial [Chitinophagales bacterium]|nr:Fic family protein [Chitinophagales bacterium]